MTQRIRLPSSRNIIIGIIIAVFIHTSVILAVTDSCAAVTMYNYLYNLSSSLFPPFSLSLSLSLPLSLSLSLSLSHVLLYYLLHFLYVRQLASCAGNDGVIAKRRLFMTTDDDGSNDASCRIMSLSLLLLHGHGN